MEIHVIILTVQCNKTGLHILNNKYGLLGGIGSNLIIIKLAMKENMT